MRWDEENRLKGVYDSEQRLSSYLYDAGGERTLKMSGSYQSTYINSSLTISSVNMTDYTLYTSPYMVMTDNEYTKHYYVEADRVASKIGGGMANAIHDVNKIVLGFDIQSENDYRSKTHEVDLMMRHDFEHLEVGVDVEVIISPEYWLGKALYQNNSEQKIYFFHKDHLGSSTQISDISANIIHHIEYMPYGESFVEQRSNWGTNYKFNGKELDDETGFYYYGARYYTPDLSIWLSVDPLSDERSWLSPYNYCQWNPVRRVDPDGMLDEENLDYYLNLGTGRVEHHKGSESRFNEGLVNIADDNSTVGEIEDALTKRNYSYQKDPSVSGGFRVDTEKQYKGWAMMQIFDPEIVGTILFMSFGTGGSSSTAKTAGRVASNTVSKSPFTVNPTKFDYFFGKVTSGSTHNIARSAQNLKDLTTLGIKNESQLMNVFNQAYKSGTVVSSKTTQYGTTIMRSVNIGKKGSVDVGFFYQGGNLNSTPSVTTIIPKIF